MQRRAEAPCYHTARMRLRGLREAMCAILAGVVLAFINTYPLVTQVHDRRTPRFDRRTMERVGRVVGRARAHDQSIRRLSREHFLSTRQRARVLGSESRRRRTRHSGVGAHPQPDDDAQLGVRVVVRVVVRRHVLPGALPRGRPARRRHCRRLVCVLSVRLRTFPAYSAADDWWTSCSACLRFIASSIWRRQRGPSRWDSRCG